jgi:hypothetical protein
MEDLGSPPEDIMKVCFPPGSGPQDMGEMEKTFKSLLEGKMNPDGESLPNGCPVS